MVVVWWECLARVHEPAGPQPLAHAQANTKDHGNLATLTVHTNLPCLVHVQLDEQRWQAAAALGARLGHAVDGFGHILQHQVEVDL